MRRIYVYDRDAGKVVPVERERQYRGTDPTVIPDVQEPFQSPVDGSWITSRRDLRRHNLTNGVVQGAERPKPRKFTPATKGVAKQIYDRLNGY